MLWIFVPVAFFLSPDAGPRHGARRPADFSIYVSLGAAVSRAKRTLASTGFARRVEQVTGAVLLALADRLALESR